MKGLRIRLPLFLASVPLALALVVGSPAAMAANGSGGSAASSTGGGTVTPFAGEVQVPAGTTMTGNVQMVAGAVRVDGTLDGAVSMAAGQVSVGPQGVITGSLTLGIGQLTVQPGGRVEGPVTVGGSSMQPLTCPAGDTTACTVASGGGAHWNAGPGPRVSGVTLPSLLPGGVRSLMAWPRWWRTAFHTLSWLGMLALALPVAALFPRALGHVVGQIEGEPGRTALIGLCAVVLAVPALVLVAITIIGIPVAIAAALGLAAAWFFGYVGVVVLVGRATLRLGGLPAPNPLLAVLVGAALVAVAEWVPILGGLVWMAVACLGVGAVLLTRFGTGSPWPRGGAGAGQPSPPPAP